MPLFPSLNDKEFLQKLHTKVLEYMEAEEARALAASLRDAGELMELIRLLPQRDDLGDPNDGPRILGEISQRLRLPTLDPSCVERLALFLALALLIDPTLNLTSATMMLDNGLHSFPVEITDGFARPVVLDPMTAPPLNAMVATVYELRNASPGTNGQLAFWFTEVARNACMEEGADECYDTAMLALRNSLLTGEPIDSPEDLSCVLALAEEDANLFGARGRAAYNRVYRSLRNLSIALDTQRVTKFLNKLVNTAEPLASSALKAALVSQFGPAAQIALQGAKLALKENKTANKTASKTASETADDAKVGSLALALESSVSDDSQSKATKAKRPKVTTRTLRRMTLGFRK